MKLMERVRSVSRVKRYSQSTERLYSHWISKFIFFHQMKHPESLGPDAINEFLSHLALLEKVSASAQNQALCAVVFLYKNVLQRDLEPFGGYKLAKRPQSLSAPFICSLVARFRENSV